MISCIDSSIVFCGSGSSGSIFKLTLVLDIEDLVIAITLANKSIALKEVKRIVELEKIEYIALGYPLNMDGSIGERAQCSIDFKKMIEDEIKGVNVVLIDERWTTKQATRFLLEGDLSRAKRKKVIDKMAAQVILDTYIQRGY